MCFALTARLREEQPHFKGSAALMARTALGGKAPSLGVCGWVVGG